MKICAKSFATATGTVGGYDAGRDDEYDYVFCGLPRGHTGAHVAMIWFFGADEIGQPDEIGSGTEPKALAS
jgi:hypothetical protein